MNGAIGIVEQVLHKSVFVLRTPDDVRILVHPVHDKGIASMPATYGYAMTIRRAQGCILEKVAIHFDRRGADRGYAYVANSRVREKQDAFHIGRIRRTDWLPVGGDLRGEEQVEPGPLSQANGSDYDPSDTSEDDESCAANEDEHRWARFAMGDIGEVDDGAAALFESNASEAGSNDDPDWSRFANDEAAEDEDGAAALFGN